MTSDHRAASGEWRGVSAERQRAARWRRCLTGVAGATFIAAALPISAQSASSRAAGGSAATAASQWDPAAVSVKVGFTATLADGKSGAATGFTTSAPSFRVGESMTAGIGSGSVQLCGDLYVGAPIDPGNTDALHAWNVTVEPTAVAGDKVRLVVDWKRFDAVPGGGHQFAAGDRRTITLSDGERHVFDFVSAPTARDATCMNMMVQVEASRRDDPKMANRTVAYDLWLVDEEPNGLQATRHIETAGKHRESIDFSFAPIGWSSDGLPAAAGGGADTLVNVDGTIKGRLQPDGSVEITVTPDRTLRIGDMTAITHYEEKTLTAKPGETIRMDIPPAEQSGPGRVRHRTFLSVTVRTW